MRPTVMEVNKTEFMNNIKKIKNFVGNKEILPVIKANGYGTHINKQLDIIDNFNIVGVVPPKKTHETYEYFKQFVLSKNLNLIEFENSCNEKKCIEKIKMLNADIGVVCSYNYLLKKDFLAGSSSTFFSKR